MSKLHNYIPLVVFKLLISLEQIFKCFLTLINLQNCSEHFCSSCGIFISNKVYSSINPIKSRGGLSAPSLALLFIALKTYAYIASKLKLFFVAPDTQCNGKMHSAIPESIFFYFWPPLVFPHLIFKHFISLVVSLAQVYLQVWHFQLSLYNSKNCKKRWR